MHPDALDLPDGRRLRAHLRLEHHLAALEAGPRAARRDQPGDPAPVSATAVTDPRIDADLADEHVDRRDQIRIEFVDAHRAHCRVHRGLRRGAQRHQRLLLTHIARRSPHVLKSAPHRHHEFGAAHQRRAAPRGAHRLVRERVEIGEFAAQRNQVGARVAQRFAGPSPRPQLATDCGRLDTVFGDPRRHHARSDGVVVEHLTHRRRVTDHRHPSLVDEAK
jgi:hypothetical protein